MAPQLHTAVPGGGQERRGGGLHSHLFRPDLSQNGLSQNGYGRFALLNNAANTNKDHHEQTTTHCIDP